MKAYIPMLALAGALALPAHAALKVTPYQDETNYSSADGGEFRAVPNADFSYILANYDSKAKGTVTGKGEGFQTFCIETTENFKPGQTYSVNIGTTALFQGGIGPDPISKGTSYLYSEFAKGTLSGYNYTYGAGRVTSAGLLQAALWYLETEFPGSGSGTYSGSNPFVLAAIAQFGSISAAQANASAADLDLYKVRVMNLGLPGEVQDMLVVVPEPSTYIAAGLLGMPVLVGALRKRSAQRRAAQA